MTSPWQQLSRVVATRPTSPLVTWYGPNGRAELSARTFQNVAAKTIGFLQDELMAEPGDTVRLRLGPHWQAVVWLQACATLGLHVDLRAVAPEAQDTIAVGFRPEDLSDEAAQSQVLVSAHPLGLPGTPLPAPFVDHARLAMAQPDQLPGDIDQDSESFEITDDSGTLIAREIPAATGEVARGWGMQAGASVLIRGAMSHRTHWLAAWQLPLRTDCHAVLSSADLTGGQLDEVIRSENPALILGPGE